MKPDFRLSKDFTLTSEHALIYKDYLCISDLHFGYEHTAVSRGVFIPKSQFKVFVSRIESLLKRHKVSNIILNGDIKHEIGRPSGQEWSEVRRFIAYLLSKFKRVVIVRGNHDNYLENILFTFKDKIEFFEDYFKVDDVIFTHGDKHGVLTFGEDTVVFGHEHPSIVLRDEVGAKLKLQAFIFKKRDKGFFINTPCFSSLSLGTDLTRADPKGLLTGILKSEGLDDFQVVAVSDEGLLPLPRLGLLQDKAELFFESI